MTDEERRLLERYAPYIHYDSMESFAADSVATMTDCVPPEFPRGNTLCQDGGHVLAAVAPWAGQSKLELPFLRGDHYPDAAQTAVAGGDYIDVMGKAYVEDAREMHVRPGMANQIYGHAKRDRQGALWLQYWLFYFYNDKAFLFVGLHEGDWEMIQLRIGARDTPDVVTYAQHANGERCEWADVEKEAGAEGPAPVVYPARGSHASYFRRGIYTQAPIVPDHNDAGGPRVRPNMNPIEDGGPAWVAWPGRWGNTKAVLGPIGADSPPGPSHHGAWRDPLTFHNNARPAQHLAAVAEASVALPATPSISVRRKGTRAVVSYSFAPTQPIEPTVKGLLVSFDGDGDGRPPATKLFDTGSDPGELTFPLDLEARPYTVRASSVGENGVTGPPAEFALASP